MGKQLQAKGTARKGPRAAASRNPEEAKALCVLAEEEPAGGVVMRLEGCRGTHAVLGTPQADFMGSVMGDHWTV